MSLKFEQEWDSFLQDQMRSASGRRLERLKVDLTGEKKLFREVLWPVFRSFDGFTLEHELMSNSGITIFVDAFYHPLNFVFESDGFVPHAERITRDRFSFEKMRIRSVARYRYTYIPFSFDELDKHPESCRRQVFELLGIYASFDERAITELTVWERETIRYVVLLDRPFTLEDVSNCLCLGKDTCRKVVRSLMENGLVRPVGQGTKKIRYYEPTELAKQYLR